MVQKNSNAVENSHNAAAQADKTLLIAKGSIVVGTRSSKSLGRAMYDTMARLATTTACTTMLSTGTPWRFSRVSGVASWRSWAKTMSRRENASRYAVVIPIWLNAITMAAVVPATEPKTNWIACTPPHGP